MAFIQYIDDSYAVKVKEIPYYDEQGYLVKDIETPFFILSLYIDNKRVNGVSLLNYDSVSMLSVINDMGNVDLNVIPENHFATAYTEIFLSVSSAGLISGIQISNFSDFQTKPLRYLKEYKLPQFRLDGRWMQGSGYAVDDRVYSMLKLGTIQGDNKFYTALHSTYRNHVDIDNLYFQGQPPGNVINGYAGTYTFPVQNNGNIVQFGDYYVKVTTQKSSYPYGLSIFIFSDIRTNEFWLYVNYIDASTSVITKGEFDIDTFVCVNGGFKIKNILQDVEVQITNIYG
ncbi:hypothetical protein D0817_19235 [Flavobacterium cupreum]|uniref:Uncharacterized protein n=2 Tax=Flavobacterium TaxID=237 RepID=A0A4Y7U9L3_9FLAO|nr:MULTISPECIES: hypothetical protein [Flavobacterium]RUT68751.1 hypothetical protein D0817_19235 [Flavobacterium cupreum]TCN55490.1 hypothetical protein EV142_106179 [Flavobacterium circumlabens]TEB43100.1 hypothetical protein D0809_16835 [Flavobacterium circumlabens]